MGQSVKVRDYVDYVAYLKDWYSDKKMSTPSFSYRVFADAAQFKSKSHLAEVVKGYKPLSKKSIETVADAMKLSALDTEYFSLLVHFSTAEQTPEKNLYWEKICALQLPSLAKRKSFRNYSFLRNWYNLPIREILSVVDFKEDYRYLGQLVWPPVSAKQAKDAVDLLLELDLVEKHGTKYAQKSFEILIDPILKKLAYHSFQKEVIQLGALALDELTEKMRYTQTISFGSNDLLNKKVHGLIDAFVSDLYTLVQQHPDVTEVQQLNVQCFSMSKNALASRNK
ncbi:MAG: TIGR02147 family protein [Reichenbachiella sp.]